jgi:hypothetical protein
MLAAQMAKMGNLKSPLQGELANLNTNGRIKVKIQNVVAFVKGIIVLP